MLTIAKVESARATYYLSTTAAGADHAGGLVEPDGVWLGRQTAALGLAGIAAPTAVRALLAGRSPVDGERLLSEPNRRRLSAYDCTFSTPKSVSVLFALGSPDVTAQIRLAHEGAVRASLDYLERNSVCVRAGRLDGRTRLTRVDGGVAAVGWLHRASRAPDPHLHTHVLIANLARCPSGEWRCLDARDIFLELRTAGALFETHLRGDLTARLGLGWGELNGAWADVEGSDRRVLRALSRRSTQIADALAESGLRGPAAARLMAEVTRPSKDVSTPYRELVESWRRRSYDEGLSSSHLASMIGRALGRRDSGLEWQASTLAGAAARSVDGTFTRRDLIQARCAAAPDGRAADAVERDVDDLLASPHLLARETATPKLRGGLRGGTPPSARRETRFATAELVAAEGCLVARVSERPKEVTVISYPPGERARALDELSNAAGAWSAGRREVTAVAPGWRAATSFEAATGIESASMRAVLRSGPAGPSGPASYWDHAGPAYSDPAGAGRTRGDAFLPEIPVGGVLVVADAQCFSTGVLAEVFAESRRRSAQTVLFGPAAFAERAVLARLAVAAKGRLPELSGPDGSPRRPEMALERRFGESAAVVTTSLRAAMADAVTQLQAAPPASVIVVAADHGIIGSLRQAVAGSGRDAFVVHANDLDATLSSGLVPKLGCDRVEPDLVVIGGASVLRAGARRPVTVPAGRRHVIVMPSVSRGSADRVPAELDAVVGWAAEACRPRYLTAELGRPPRNTTERARWRSSAAMIEAFRERWGVTDPRNAFGLGRQFGSQLNDWNLDRQQVRDNVCRPGLTVERGQSRARGLTLGR